MYSGGTGTQADPYQIGTLADLQALATAVNSGTSYSGVYFKQTADIDLASVSNWTPIGNSEAKFSGIFDGDNWNISNLTINTSNDFQGLFGYTLNASFQNIQLTDVNITGDLHVGSLAGAISAGGRISSSITNCYASGTVTGSYSVGGLVGLISVWGGSSSSITNCYATGTVTGGSFVGGLVGYNDAYGSGSSSSITNCYASGNVTGDTSGGLVGYNKAQNDGSSSVITSVALNPTVTGSSNTGRIIGLSSGTTITECYALSTMSAGGATDGIDVTPADAESQSFYEDTLGWDFDTIWKMGSTYPIFKTVTQKFSGGSGTATDPYLIGTPDDLVELSNDTVGGTSYTGNFFRQIADIDMAGIDWVPLSCAITTPSIYFAASYDGNGFIISNLTSNLTGSLEYAGFIGRWNSGANGVLQNITLYNINMFTTGNDAGGLVGMASIVATADPMGYIKNCCVQGSVSGRVNSGGIVGQINSQLSIQQCYFKGTVTCPATGYAGGIAAYSGGSIYDTPHVIYEFCVVDATITSTGRTGGISGYNATSISISNCITFGSYSGKSFAGGILAQNQTTDTITRVNECVALCTSLSAEGSIYRIGPYTEGSDLYALSTMSAGTATDGTNVTEATSKTRAFWESMDNYSVWFESGALFMTLTGYPVREEIVRKCTPSATTGGEIRPAVEFVGYPFTTPSYIMTADTGYIFTDVSLNGVSQGAVTPFSFTALKQANTVAATFSRDATYHTFTISSTGPGTTDPTGTVQVEEGGSLTITFVPNENAHAVGFTQNGVYHPVTRTGQRIPYTNVTEDYTVVVAYSYFGGGSGTKADPYLIATPEDLKNIYTLGTSYWVYGLHYKQIANLDMTPYAAEWVSLGSRTNWWQAEYDGQMYAIQGIGGSKTIFAYASGDGDAEYVLHHIYLIDSLLTEGVTSGTVGSQTHVTGVRYIKYDTSSPDNPTVHEYPLIKHGLYLPSNTPQQTIHISDFDIRNFHISNIDSGTGTVTGMWGWYDSSYAPITNIFRIFSNGADLTTQGTNCTWHSPSSAVGGIVAGIGNMAGMTTVRYCVVANATLHGYCSSYTGNIVGSDKDGQGIDTVDTNYTYNVTNPKTGYNNGTPTTLTNLNTQSWWEGLTYDFTTDWMMVDGLPTLLSPDVVTYQIAITKFGEGTLNYTGTINTIAGSDFTLRGTGISNLYQVVDNGVNYDIDNNQYTIENVSGNHTISARVRLFSGGSGTATDPYLISTVEDLVMLSENGDYWSDYYLQTTDLDLSQLTTWTAIGTNESYYFSGHYDGGKHILSGLPVLNITAASGYQGVFGYVAGNGSVHDVIIKDFHVVGSICRFGGLLIGNLYGGNMYNCAAIDCSYRCTGTTECDLGALAGHTRNCTITDCYAWNCVIGDASMTQNDNDAGAISANAADSATFERCYAWNCTLYAKRWVASIVPHLYGSSTARELVAISCNVNGGGGNSWRIGRVVEIFTGSPTMSDLYSTSDTLVNGAVVTGGTSTNKNGEDIPIDTLHGIGFWKNTLNFVFNEQDGPWLWGDQTMLPVFIDETLPSIVRLWASPNRLAPPATTTLSADVGGNPSIFRWYVLLDNVWTLCGSTLTTTYECTEETTYLFRLYLENDVGSTMSPVIAVISHAQQPISGSALCTHDQCVGFRG